MKEKEPWAENGAYGGADPGSRVEPALGKMKTQIPRTEKSIGNDVPGSSVTRCEF